jgi:hypothetical protein
MCDVTSVLLYGSVATCASIGIGHEAWLSQRCFLDLCLASLLTTGHHSSCTCSEKLPFMVQAESLAKLLEDKRAERAGLRMRAKALRKVESLPCDLWSFNC